MTKEYTSDEIDKLQSYYKKDSYFKPVSRGSALTWTSPGWQNRTPEKIL